MLFLNSLLIGFAFTLGVEIALGLCYAIKHVSKNGGEKK